MTIEVLVFKIISKRTGLILFACPIKDYYEKIQISLMRDTNDYMETQLFEKEFIGTQEVQHLISENFLINIETYELDL